MLRWESGSLLAFLELCNVFQLVFLRGCSTLRYKTHLSSFFAFTCVRFRFFEIFFLYFYYGNEPSMPYGNVRSRMRRRRFLTTDSCGWEACTAMRNASYQSISNRFVSGSDKSCWKWLPKKSFRGSSSRCVKPECSSSGIKNIFFCFCWFWFLRKILCSFKAWFVIKRISWGRKFICQSQAKVESRRFGLKLFFFIIVL